MILKYKIYITVFLLINTNVWGVGGKYDDISADEAAKRGVGRYYYVLPDGATYSGGVQFLHGYEGRVAVTASHIFEHRKLRHDQYPLGVVKIGNADFYPNNISLITDDLEDTDADVALLFFDPEATTTVLSDEHFPKLPIVSVVPVDTPFNGTLIGTGPFFEYSNDLGSILEDRPKLWGRRGFFSVNKGLDSKCNMRLVSEFIFPSKFSEPLNESVAYQGDSGAGLIDESNYLRGVTSSVEMETILPPIDREKFKEALHENMKRFGEKKFDKWDMPFDAFKITCKQYFCDISKFNVLLWIYICIYKSIGIFDNSLFLYIKADPTCIEKGWITESSIIETMLRIIKS